MSVTVEIVDEHLPEHLKELAATWSACVVASLDKLQEEGTSEADASLIIDLALHSAAAVIAPGELAIAEFVMTVQRFSRALADVTAAYIESKAEHEATRQ